MASTDKPRPFKRQALDRHSTPSQMADALEEEILSGGLKPAERLREAELAEAFSVSRNSVREALRELERRQLVRHIPHRGVEVVTLTKEDLYDLFQARAVLERAGLRLAGGSESAVAMLAEQAERIATAAEDGDAVSLLEHDFNFHRILVEQIGSRRLRDQYASLQRELRLALGQLDNVDSTAQAEEHRQIVDALRARRVEEADELLCRHLNVAASRIGDLVVEHA